MSELGIVAKEQHGNITVLLPDSAEMLANNDSGLFTSLDRKVKDHQRLIVKALGIADKRVEDVLRQKIIVAHIVAHNISPVDPATGEIVQTVRIVFVSPDGSTIAGSGKGIYNSLRNIINIMGSPPWVPGLEIMINPVTTRLGRRTYTIELVQDEQPDDGKKRSSK